MVFGIDTTYFNRLGQRRQLILDLFFSGLADRGIDHKSPGQSLLLFHRGLVNLRRHLHRYHKLIGKSLLEAVT